MKLLLIILCVSVIGYAGSASVKAETTRYGQWQRGDRVQQLVDELRTLIQQAERARAADRRFLGDLRELLRRYDWPWRNELLRDDFQDGDYYANPVWRVIEGAFRVDPRDGLIAELSAAPPPPTPPPAQPTRKKNAGRDLALTLLGGLLNPQGTQGGGATQSPTAPAATPTANDRALIGTDLRIPNAFALRVRLRAIGQDGTLQLGMRQRASGSGYRLVLRGAEPGAEVGLELVRVSRHGRSVIGGYYERSKLRDGATHTLQWTRGRRGEMVISVDQKTLIEAVDTRLRDGFDSLTLEQRVQPFAVREVTVWGR